MDANRSTGQRCVVVTSSPGSFPGLEARLADFEVTVRRQPLLAVDLAEDLSGIDRALAASGTYQAVVCTSPRAATVVAARWRRDASAPEIWCCGEPSARAWRDLDVRVVTVDGEYTDPATATALVSQLVGALRLGRVLVVSGEPDLPDVASRLTDAGLRVDVAVAYRSQRVSDVELLATLERAEVLLVASPVVVRALADQGDDALLPAWLAVGRSTADACRLAGVPLMGTADEPTTASVASALRTLLATRFHLQPRAPV